MSRVTDTAARILANVDGETKQESHGSEEVLEVLDAVVEELTRRADHMRPNVEAMRRDREALAHPDETSDDSDAELMASDMESEGAPVPAVSQPENTPATHVDRAPISMAGAEGANDLE